MKTVVIDRAKWAIPRQTGQPLLFSSAEGTRCCLGFYVKSCGVADDDAEDMSMPSELNVQFPGKASLLKRSGSYKQPSALVYDWEGILASVNDAENATDAEREAWVREGFKRILKRNVRFVGKYRVPEPK